MSRRHQKCLANIARLERQLFPDYFASEIKPVKAWNHVQILNGLNLLGSGLAAQSEATSPDKKPR